MFNTSRIVTILFLSTSRTILSFAFSNSTSTKVTFWCDQAISSDSKLAVDNLVAKLNSDFNASLVVEIFALNFSTNCMQDTLHSLENYSKDGSVFVVSTLSIKDTWLWSTLLCQRNSMIIDIRNPARAHTEESADLEITASTNMLSLIPPPAERRPIFQEILAHMLCKKNVTITSCSSFEQENLRELLKLARDKMIFCVVLECREHLGSLFLIAKSLEMLGRRYRWFVFHHDVKLINFEVLPENLISVRLSEFDDFSAKGSAMDSCVNIPFLSDALTLVAKAKGSYETTLRAGYAMRRKFLQTKFAGETGLVSFNKHNARTGGNYDVLHLIRIANATGWLKIGMRRSGSFDTRLMSWIANEVSQVSPPLLRISTKKNKPWVFLAAEQYVNSKTSECIVGIKCINYTSYTNEVNNSFEQYCCTGMLVELLQALTERIAFTPRLHFVKDKKFGSLDATTHQWNGMIGEVLRDEADTAMYTLTITERRARAVEFSYPIIAAGSGILVAVDNQNTYKLINTAFLYPLKSDLWFATIAILGAVTVILWIAERLNQQRCYYTFLGNGDKLGIHTLVESMSYSWGVFVQKVIQEGGPRTLGGRVIVGTFGFYIIIMLSSYTANMAAIKVAEDDEMEISGIYDEKFMNPTSDFKFTSSKFTATSEFFKQSMDNRLKEIYKVMKDRLVSTRAEALELLKSGEIQAFFEDTPALHYMASQQEDCNLKVVGKSFGNSGYGMPFRHNSSWVKSISLALSEMHESGVITKLSEKWLKSACVTKKSVQIAKKWEVRDASGLLLLLAVSCAGSFLVLVLEIFFKKVFLNFCFTRNRFLSYKLTATRNI